MLGPALMLAQCLHYKQTGFKQDVKHVNEENPTLKYMSQFRMIIYRSLFRHIIFPITSYIHPLHNIDKVSANVCLQIHCVPGTVDSGMVYLVWFLLPDLLT